MFIFELLLTITFKHRKDVFSNNFGSKLWWNSLFLFLFLPIIHKCIRFPMISQINTLILRILLKLWLIRPRWLASLPLFWNTRESWTYDVIVLFRSIDIVILHSAVHQRLHLSTAGYCWMTHYNSWVITWSVGFLISNTKAGLLWNAHVVSHWTHR